jgi:hypothetical protein
MVTKIGKILTEQQNASVKFSTHIAVIQTPAGSHICSSGSCGGKALAEFLPRNEMEHAKTVTARTNTQYTPQEQIKKLPLRIFHN